MIATLQETQAHTKKESGHRTAVIAQLHRASKSFGEVQALRQVNFAVRAGELVALLGPNGAGQHESNLTHWEALIGFSLICLGVARLGFQRDEGKMYG